MRVSFCGSGSFSGGTSSRVFVAWQFIAVCAGIRCAYPTSRQNVSTTQPTNFRDDKLRHGSNRVTSSSDKNPRRPLHSRRKPGSGRLMARRLIEKEFVCVGGGAALRCRQFPSSGGIHEADCGVLWTSGLIHFGGFSGKRTTDWEVCADPSRFGR